MSNPLSVDLTNLAQALACVTEFATEDAARRANLQRFIAHDVAQSVYAMAIRAQVLEDRVRELPDNVVDLRDILGRERRDRLQVIEGGAA